MAKPFTVQAQIELLNGQPRVVKGKVDPERTLTSGSLGVYLHQAEDQRGRLTSGLPWTVIPWAQIRMLHIDDVT